MCLPVCFVFLCFYDISHPVVIQYNSWIHGTYINMYVCDGGKV